VSAPRIAVVDYGMGNRRSVEKALEHTGARALVTGDHDEIGASDGLVVPGVGAFPRAAESLRTLGLDEVIANRLADGVPVLGICLGLQLLFESSSELGGATGLGLLPGAVTRLDALGAKLPHIGWSVVSWRRESRLTAGLPEACAFYHVHSFVPRPVAETDVLGVADYGERFVTAVDREPLFGVQFHPEKSSAHGLRLLANFTQICARVAA